MRRPSALATLASAVLGAALIAAAVASRPTAVADGTFTLDELARHDGRDGRPCLVAVDGQVYVIDGFELWRDGEHTPSGGRARCGRDLTAALAQSPHGRSKLILLDEIGTVVEDSR